MYIGSTDSRGVGHLVNEILDNSTDEGVAGHATRVEVTLHADGSVQVDDDGRGIPPTCTPSPASRGRVGADPAACRRQVRRLRVQDLRWAARGRRLGGERAVASLRRDREAGRQGAPDVVPARRSGGVRRPRPGAAFTAQPGLRVVGTMKRGESTGTSIRYWHDARYFETGACSTSTPSGPSCATPRSWSRRRLPAARCPPTAGRPTETFRFPNGLTDMVDFLTPAGDRAVCGTLLVIGAGTYKENAADENGVMRANVERRAEVEVALRWGTGYERTVECFANTDPQRARWHASQGLRARLVRALTEAMRNSSRTAAAQGGVADPRRHSGGHDRGHPCPAPRTAIHLADQG